MKHFTRLSFVPVLAACLAIPAGASVIVNSPTNGAVVGSSFNLSANAPNCSSQTISAMGYSFDNSPNTMIINSSSVNTQIGSSLGSHTLHVKAWGNQGSSCVTDVALTVTSGASTNGPSIPSNAISVSSIQALSGWSATRDTAVGGSASGWTGLVSSPAYSGTARQFATSYSGYANERYDIAFADDTTSTNFVYDGWVYLTSSVSSVANIEMDMNQVMSNGQTVIFGFQCDGWSGTWDYTANGGSPSAPIDEWLHTGAQCNIKNWSINAWHHVQVSYSRDGSGNVTYKAVWLDGNEQQLNITAPSSFALGWAPVLLTNFQVDEGVSASASSTVYLDNLTIYRW